MRMSWLTNDGTVQNGIRDYVKLRSGKRKVRNSNISNFISNKYLKKMNLGVTI